MKGLLKDMYIHNIDEIADKYNNRDQGAIKIKPVNVTLSNYIYFDAENSVKVL